MARAVITIVWGADQTQNQTNENELVEITR